MRTGTGAGGSGSLEEKVLKRKGGCRSRGKEGIEERVNRLCEMLRCWGGERSAV